ncbi:MAG: putative GCN5-related N-acetyltransferase [Solirubrobacterales bacterium]|nr:putative GCN5-related N-acetyltransferase [Solirubrobacterales bacterium]
MSRTPVIITSLQLTNAARVRAPSRPPPPGLTIARAHAPELNHLLYTTIGQDFNWTDRLPWTTEQWTTYAGSVETQVATLGDKTAGYYELRERDGAVEVAIFGLLEHARGLGVGGHLLAHALRRGLQIAPRVWLHTCTDDAPHALANYRARGLQIFDVRPV